jgi:hypothetical protein
MPVPFTNKLRGSTAEPENDLLELSIFALPDLKTIPEEAVDLGAGGFGVRKLVRGPGNLLHPGEHEDPAGFAAPVVTEQIR